MVTPSLRRAIREPRERGRWGPHSGWTAPKNNESIFARCPQISRWTCWTSLGHREKERERKSTIRKINWFIKLECVFSFSWIMRRSASVVITIDNTRHKYAVVLSRKIAKRISPSVVRRRTMRLPRRCDARLRIHAPGDYVRAHRCIATPLRRAEAVSRYKVFSPWLEFSCERVVFHDWILLSVARPSLLHSSPSFLSERISCERRISYRSRDTNVIRRR